ncbi:serendipity locus protein H-1-like isoform X2 [Prorops nasuta]|uniref:serendipity locus protein H-1-like isoform X2 n=1 Tax=Prorops nasuta TaxID=863751 RepID=UPI0034CF03F5
MDSDCERDDECQCRICAMKCGKNNVVDIFTEDGKRYYLQMKIRKYLYILISAEDNLSKMVCCTCIKKVENFHRFAMMAHRTQEKLKTQLKGDQLDNMNYIEGNETEHNKEENDILNKIGSCGLLHSILTKGAIEILSDSDSLGPEEELQHNDKQYPSTEEMEVKVDPMLFLQYGMDRSASDASEMSDIEEEITMIESPVSRLSTDRMEVETETVKESNDEKLSEGSNEDIPKKAVKPHKCTICARSFVSQIGLQNHLWSHLPRERKIDGKFVLKSPQVFSLNGVLHSNVDNTAVGNFICPICSKKISTKGNLKVHLETHRPKGKYGCDICGRIFKTQSNLFRHKEYHGGIQFPCNVCGRVYPTNSTLRAHSITHSDLRPHACPLCDKTFKRNQDLKFHINQHTGARPYQCPYCPKAFASSGNCFSHRKRMHPREVHRDRQRVADLMR